MTENKAEDKSANETSTGKSLIRLTPPVTLRQKQVLIALSVVVVLLLIGLILLWSKQNQSVTRFTDSQDRVLQGNQQLQQQLQQLGNQLSSLTTETDKLSAAQQQLRDALQVLQKERPETERDWVLREAEYLILIAMRRLQLEQDVDTALVALQTADARVLALANPALIPLREQITTDMNALRSVELTDITSMTAYLSDLQKQVDTLPLKSSITETSRSQLADAVPTEPVNTGWKAIPERIWQELKSLVVIRRSDDSGVSFVMPEEHYYVIQNLKLELANARLAVLRRDSPALQASVDQISDWLQRYFNADTAAVNSILTGMGQLRQQNLSPSLPDISGSLQQVRKFLAAD